MERVRVTCIYNNKKWILMFDESMSVYDIQDYMEEEKYIPAGLAIKHLKSSPSYSGIYDGAELLLYDSSSPVDDSLKSKNGKFKSETKDNGCIFGIDLGTTNSVISYIDENRRIKTCMNEEGSEITPSVVDLSDVNPIVGQLAKDNKFLDPWNIFDFFKRKMRNGNAKIYYGEDLDKETTAIELSAEVLRYLAKYASEITGLTVKRAIIAIPFYYGMDEKMATKEAAEKAGFKDVFFIEEPTAAAIYYGYKADKRETVLVYDLGGGKFDVAAVEIDGFNCNCFCGDEDFMLGGKDWDICMMDIIKDKLIEIGVDVSGLEDTGIVDFQTVAERAKKSLTRKETTDVKIEIMCKMYRVVITRDEFEEKTKELLDRTIVITKEVRDMAKSNGHEITKILLVGGSCYMPQIYKRLCFEFPDLEVPNPIEPNLAISKGAAYFAFKVMQRQIQETQEIYGPPSALGLM